MRSVGGACGELVQISPGLFSQLIEQNLMAWLKRLAFLDQLLGQAEPKRSMCAWSSSDKLCCVLKGYLSLLCNRSLVSYVGAMYTIVGREGEIVEGVHSLGESERADLMRHWG